MFPYAIFRIATVYVGFFLLVGLFNYKIKHTISNNFITLCPKLLQVRPIVHVCFDAHRHTDKQTNGWKDRRTDGRTDR